MTVAPRAERVSPLAPVGPCSPSEFPTPGDPGGTHQADLGANEQVRHLRSAAPDAAPRGTVPGAAPGPAPPPPPPGSGGEKAPKGVRGHRGLRRIPRDPGPAVLARDGQEMKG